MLIRRCSSRAGVVAISAIGLMAFLAGCDSSRRERAEKADPAPASPDAGPAPAPGVDPASLAPEGFEPERAAAASPEPHVGSQHGELQTADPAFGAADPLPLSQTPPAAPGPSDLGGSPLREPSAAPPQAIAEVPPVQQPPAPTGFSENPLRGAAVAFPVAADSGAAPSQPDSALAEAAPQPEKKKAFGKGKHSGVPFDPILENGPIFVDWGKPKLAMVISGRQDGYLEPCGCAGLDRMKGGLSRRHMLFEQLRGDGWPTLGLDCGGLVKGFGRQAELKFGLTVDSMQRMGYDAIALGKSDLRLPATELLARAASTAEVQSPFLSANVAIFGFDLGMTADHRILEAGGLRVGVTSVLGSKWQKEISNPDIEMADPEAKLREILPKMEGKCDLMVLLAHATMEESVELAKAFPQFDIVVTAGGAPEPPAKPEQIQGKTLLIEVGEKGMDAIVLGVYQSDQPIRYQRVPLDSRFPESPTMKMFMEQYQQQLKQDGLAGLGIRQVAHQRKEEMGRFVGSAKCESCHEPSYEVWKKTGHAKAWDTLKQLSPPRTHDPECISCHVVGWHPTEYFPYESGFLSEAETPHLIDVGCESCHGPGEKHVEAEMGSDAELQKRFQQAMVVTKEQARSSKTHWCLNCHDLDNSPDFDFDEYWPHVEHKEDIWSDDP